MSRKTKEPADNSALVNQVVAWAVSGQTEADIAEAIREQWPDAESRPLIISAMEKLEEAGEPNPQLVRGFAIEGTREIYRKSLEIGDHQTALRSLAQLVKLSQG